jgi:folate-dependent phosphoribosylglycinamide formyltransferase PurN
MQVLPACESEKNKRKTKQVLNKEEITKHRNKTTQLRTNIKNSSKSRIVITGFVTILTRRVPLVEQQLLTLPEHLSSPPVFSGFVLLDL